MQEYLDKLLKSLLSEVEALKGFKLTTYPDNIIGYAKIEYREKAEELYNQLIQSFIANMPSSRTVSMEKFINIEQVKNTCKDDYIKEILYVEHAQYTLKFFRAMLYKILEESYIHKWLNVLKTSATCLEGFCESSEFYIDDQHTAGFTGCLALEIIKEGLSFRIISKLQFCISDKPLDDKWRENFCAKSLEELQVFSRSHNFK